ncbi:A-kinase anchor protein 1, mitochondrial [Melanerpes formicivorus]|uniref:A-kinase anchor protein 1, mitochondrial n=1 Tax=Melanerpes formicivorus TaxID=211600 RepID=UPI003590222F
MALRFHNAIPYAIPGVLALLGCWWMYSHRKKHASYPEKQATATEEEKQEAVQEKAQPGRTAACVRQRLPLSPEEECPESETSTFLLSAWSTTPSLLSPTHERLELSQDLSVATAEPSTPEDDSEKLDRIGPRGGSAFPACVALPLLPESTEPPSSAAVSPTQDSGSPASPGQWPAVSLPLAQEPLGVSEQISGAEHSDDSSFKPPKEIQMPEMMLSNPGSVTALCLGLGKEGNAPQAFLSSKAEAVPGHEDSAASLLAESSERPGEEQMSESVAGTVPACLEEAQPKGEEVEREKPGGVSLDKAGVEEIEQVAIEIISKVILAAAEEVLSGAAGDVSTQVCQAPASRAERPLEMTRAVPSAQVLAEEAAAAGESAAVKGDAAAPSPLRPEEQGRCAAGSGCSPSPAPGGAGSPGVGSHLCSQGQAAGLAPVGSHGAALAKSPLVMEDSGYSTCACEGGTGVEEPLQDPAPAVASGQHSNSLSTSAAPGTSEQSSAPREKPALKPPEGSNVAYSNGILQEDGPDLQHECSRAAEIGGEHSGGADVESVDFVDSGCAMRRTVSRQKLGGEASKPDFVIWEIEVPKELVGRLIGKQGRFMSFLRQASGAKIYVSTLPYFHDSQVCHIEGSMQQVEKVLSLIGKKFKELCLTNIYALPPPTPLTLHSLLMTAWLFLPDGVTVEVVVSNQVDAGHMFLQQHTHPTFHVLRSLDQQMSACYSQPEIPTLPTPVEVGIICAAPGLDGAWLRAQVISYFEETNEVELRYVDYGGYDRVKVDTLRQIRSDFLSLPFQGAEVLLDNVVPLPDEDHFSSEADAAVSEMTRGAVLVAQVTNYDSATGLPLIQLWNLMGDEVVSINRTLVERGFAQWLDY